jgi:hypothetical protein
MALRGWHIALISVGAAVIVLPILAFMIFAAVIGVWGLDSKVSRGAELPERHERVVRAIAGLAPDEQILYFYSTGVFDPSEDGNLLTNRGVYSWGVDNEERWLGFARFEHIEDLDLERIDGWMEDSVLTVTATGAEIMLVLSPEKNRDKAFVAEARRRMAAARPVTAPVAVEPPVVP